MEDKNDRKQDLQPAGLPGAAGPEPKEPTFAQNLIVFVKILAIGAAIIALIWILDQGVS